MPLDKFWQMWWFWSRTKNERWPFFTFSCIGGIYSSRKSFLEQEKDTENPFFRGNSTRRFCPFACCAHSSDSCACLHRAKPKKICMKLLCARLCMVCARSNCSNSRSVISPFNVLFRGESYHYGMSFASTFQHHWCSSLFYDPLLNIPDAKLTYLTVDRKWSWLAQ